MPSLLLVQATDDDRELYTECLRREGFTVTAVGSTDAAMPLIDSADCVITGILVPGAFEGVELIRRIREGARTATVPIIVVTACALGHEQERARRAGADVILQKPCLPNVLAEAVRRMLNRSGSMESVTSADRRTIPDRRAEWRGGRRDIDWRRRPANALAESATVRRRLT